MLPLLFFEYSSGVLQQNYGQPNTGKTRTENNKDITWVIVGNRTASIGIVACSYLFVATFATTWGPTSWTYPAEIFPSRIRAKAVSISTATNWLFNMALAFAVPPLRRELLPLLPLPFIRGNKHRREVD